MSDEIKQSRRGGKRKNAGRKPRAALTESSPKTDHLWKPGQSGNPGGRPAVIREVRDLARAHTVTAFNTLLSVCENCKAPPAARVAAAAHILDRGFGKPQQSIVSTIRDARRYTDDELYAFLIESEGGGGITAEAEGSLKPH